MTGYKFVRRRSTILLMLFALIMGIEAVALSQHSRSMMFLALALTGCLAVVGVVFGLQTVRELNHTDI